MKKLHSLIQHLADATSNATSGKILFRNQQVSTFISHKSLATTVTVYMNTNTGIRWKSQWKTALGVSFFWNHTFTQVDYCRPNLL